MKYASIDIGTNTILMLVGEIDDAGAIRKIADFYEVPRVGRNVSKTKRLSPESIDRGISVLERYSRTASEYGVERIVASATSAVRDAENRDDFLSRANEKLGAEVEVIDGKKEAELAFLGALSGAEDRSSHSMVIDIGGGSTEISGGVCEPEIVESIDIGAVRLTEQFFKNNPPGSEELLQASKFVDDALKSFPFSLVKADRHFGVAGTATTLALIAQGKHEFDLESVSNYSMSMDSLRSLFTRLRKMSPSEIRSLTSAAAGREDVLLAGCLILVKVLDAAGAKSFISTDRGIRYGYMIYKHIQSLRS